jgi:haloalkane dehalogenase
MTTQLPPWLDRTEYPFALHTFQVPAGRLNYVDEGQGPPLVFVHGNPSWSFEFRHVIKQLSATRRCIAVDHLGFGLSDKPADFSYLPVDQAKNFSLFMESLDLHDVTLVVGDWGGPIGLSYALEHPERIRSLVITNTWLWSVKSDWYYQGFSGFMGGPIGRHLIRTRNFFADQVVKACFPDKRALTPLVHRHFLEPLANPADRKGNQVFPKQIIGSSTWLAGLWERRAVLADKRVLLAWGLEDIAFRKKELATWVAAFPRATVLTFAGVGHFVCEERGPELSAAIERLDA